MATEETEDTSTAAQKPAAPAAAPATQDFFFPQYGVTVAAVSREDAETKLAALLKDKN